MRDNQTIPVCVVLGPTAVGKSDVALHLAECFGGEIVNFDSQQLYADVEIGVAKPSRRQRRYLPHHLYDLPYQDAALNAPSFAKLAIAKVQQIQQRRAVPILVGGTGFYLRALTAPLPEIPATDAKIRQQVQVEIAQHGLDSAYQRLQQVDPVLATRLSRFDRQRIARGLEVWQMTAKPLSQWQTQPVQQLPWRWLKLGLTMPKPLLHQRIDVRSQVLFRAGILDEVKILGNPASRGIGYAEAKRYLDGELSLEAAIALTAKRTREYAKRQLTWFRREKEVDWFDVQPQWYEQTLLQLQQKVADFLGYVG